MIWASLFVFFAFCSFRYKRSPIVLILLLGLCVVIMGFNTYNADYENYVNRYEWASYPDSDNLLSLLDISYSSFQVFFKDIGVTAYEQFRIIHTILIFVIFGKFICKNCYYYNVFFAIFAVCYLVIDTIQIRNFTGFVILLPFIPLLSKKTAKSTFLYVVGVLLSSTIHYSMSFFIIFAFINIKSKQLRSGLIVLFLIILILSSSLISSSAAFERADEYARSSILGALFGSLFVICSFLIMNKATNYNKNIEVSNENNYSSKLDFALMKEINLYLLFILPFFFINAAIGRLFRYVSMINLVFLLNTVYLSKTKRDKLKWKMIIFVYVCYFAIYYIYSKPQVFLPVFINNSLIP